MSVFFRFLILIFAATLALPAHCEKLPSCLTKYERSTPEQYASYKAYFQDYFERLNKNYKLKGRFPHRIHSGTNVKLKLLENWEKEKIKKVDRTNFKGVVYKNNETI